MHIFVDVSRRIIEHLKEAGYEVEVEFLLSEPWHIRYQTFVMIPEVRKTQALTAKSKCFAVQIYKYLWYPYTSLVQD